MYTYVVWWGQSAVAPLPHIPTRAVALHSRQTERGTQLRREQPFESTTHAAFGLVTFSHKEQEWIIISLSLVLDPFKTGGLNPQRADRRCVFVGPRIFL